MKTVETPDCSFCKDDDGILYAQFTPGASITLEKAQECARVSFEQFPQRPLLLLISLEGLRSIDREAREYFASLPSSEVIVALVGLSPIARVIGAIFIGLTRGSRSSVRTFGSQEAARAWLTTFLPVAAVAGVDSEREME